MEIHARRPPLACAFTQTIDVCNNIYAHPPLCAAMMPTTMPTRFSSFLKILLWTLLLNPTFSSADQVVYLDRPANAILAKGGNVVQKEPIFNPNKITADIGEKVQFIARFENQVAYAGVLNLFLLECN